MNDLREHLHALVDQLPDDTLEHARIALEYCRDPEKHRLNIEQAKRRVQEKSRRRLREFAERTGQGYISGVGSGGGMTFADGDHHSSMIAFEDGKKPLTTCTYIEESRSRSSKQWSFLPMASS